MSALQDRGQTVYDQGVAAPALAAFPVDPVAEKRRDSNQKAAVSNFGNYSTYYYAGAAAEIYFDNVFIDEISGLTFSAITNKAPLYGYASKYFDAVAQGNFLVQGSFSINFVNQYYLNVIAMELYRAKQGKDTKPSFTFKFDDNAATKNALYARSIVRGITGLGNAEFKAIAKQYGHKQYLEAGRIATPFDELPPFDIWAVFGDYATASEEGTAKKIKDVYLVSSNMVLSPTGDPVQETYSFIARDIE